MKQQGRASTSKALLMGLTLLSTVSASAQVTHVDFQVIHLPRVMALPAEHYVAIRTPEQWAALQRGNNPNSAPIPAIDFKHFILLIAQTGVRGSSRYSNVFASVDTIPAPMTAPTSSKKDVTSVQIIEIGPGNYPRLTELSNSIAYAHIPQTTSEIRFVVAHAYSNCNIPPNPAFVK